MSVKARCEADSLCQPTMKNVTMLSPVLNGIIQVRQVLR